MYSIKEKSWSVRLAFGQVLNGRVRSEQCGNCDSVAKLIIGNNDDSNLVLYGCNSKSCKHILMRVDFTSSGPQNFSVIEPTASLQIVKEEMPITRMA